MKTITKNKEYNVSHNFICNYIKLSELTNCEYFIEGDGKYIIHVIDQMTGNGGVDINKTHKVCAILNKEQVDKILSAPELVSVDKNLGNGGYLPQVKDKENPIFLVKREFLEFYRKYGTDNTSYNVKKEEVRQLNDFICEDLFEKVEKNSFKNDYIFIQFKESATKFIYIETSDGEKILPPIYLSYIEGSIDNSEFKLEEFAEHILVNHNVDFYKDDRRRNIVNSKSVEKDTDLAGIIKSIPYYNQDDGRTEFMEMHFFASKEEADKILDPNTKLNDYWSRQNYIVREIMGGKHFLVNPPVEEQKEVKKNKFRS